MADGQNETQNTSSPQNSGDAGGTSDKLIFGKYKTVEDAEKAYKELERKYHEGNERYVQLDSRLAAVEQQGYSTDEGYGRGAPAAPVADPNENTQLLTRFYADPKGTLEEIEDRATRKALNTIQQTTQRNADYQQRVAKWAAENPDVTAYGDLLTFYTQQTDARLTPETRLTQAAEQVRKRVIELKGQAKVQQENPATFVDGATSVHGDGTRSAAPQQGNGNESVLKSYVAERNTHNRRPLQHGGTK